MVGRKSENRRKKKNKSFHDFSVKIDAGKANDDRNIFCKREKSVLLILTIVYQGKKK